MIWFSALLWGGSALGVASGGRRRRRAGGRIPANDNQMRTVRRFA